MLDIRTVPGNSTTRKFVQMKLIEAKVLSRRWLCIHCYQPGKKKKLGNLCRKCFDAFIYVNICWYCRNEPAKAHTGGTCKRCFKVLKAEQAAKIAEAQDRKAKKREEKFGA